MPSPETFKHDLLKEFKNIAEATNAESSLKKSLSELQEELKQKNQLGEVDLDSLQRVVNIGERLKEATEEINASHSRVLAMFNADLRTVIQHASLELTLDGYNFKIHQTNTQETKLYGGGFKFEVSPIA